MVIKGNMPSFHSYNSHYYQIGSLFYAWTLNIIQIWKYNFIQDITYISDIILRYINTETTEPGDNDRKFYCH